MFQLYLESLKNQRCTENDQFRIPLLNQSIWKVPEMKIGEITVELYENICYFKLMN